MTQDRLNQFLAAVRAARGPARGPVLAALAEAARNTPLVLAAFRALNALGPAVAVEYAARMAAPVPQALVLLVAPSLSRRDIPLVLRLSAAGKLLESLPDTPASVGPVVRSLTAGLGRTKALERMTQLQSRVAVCTTLDAMTAAQEKIAKYRCAECGVRKSRAGLAKHLWKQHRTLYTGGKTHGPAKQVEAAAEQVVTTHDAEAVDRAHLWAELCYDGPDPARVHQAILTRLPPVGDDLLPLLKAAAERNAGLCPNCFSDVPPAFPPLPPPLAVGGGAASGNGYRIDAVAGKLTWPLADPEPLPVLPRMSPRVFASRLAVVLAIAAFVGVMVLPAAWVKPVWWVIWLLLAAAMAYTATLFIRKPALEPNDAAIDAAWNAAATRVGRSPAAVAFLIRLCRASLDFGTTTERTERVWELAEHSAVLAKKGPDYAQLLAAAAVLQSYDESQFGRDWLPGLLKVFTPIWTAEQPPGYADAAAACLLASDALPDPTAARLRVGLLGAAFDAGFTPADLDALAELAPQFARLWAGPAEWRSAAFSVWQSRHARPWEKVAPAETVFEFAKKSPTAGRALAAHPDAVLISRLDRAADAVLGAVIVGTKGVSVAGVTVADPDAAVRIDPAAAASVLVFGPHKVGLAKRVSRKVAEPLQGWLKYRAEVLMPLADRDFKPAAAAVAKLTAAATVTCAVCDAKAVVRVGEVGREIPAG